MAGSERTAARRRPPQAADARRCVCGADREAVEGLKTYVMDVTRTRLSHERFFTGVIGTPIAPLIHVTLCTCVILSESESRLAGRGGVEGSRGCLDCRCSVREFSRECLDAVSLHEAPSGSFDYAPCRHLTDAAARRFAQDDSVEGVAHLECRPV